MVTGHDHHLGQWRRLAGRHLGGPWWPVGHGDRLSEAVEGRSGEGELILIE